MVSFPLLACCYSLMRVCAAWGEDMDQVAQMLKDDRRMKDDTVVWFCIFANYQPGDGSGPSIAAQLERDPFGLSLTLIGFAQHT